MRKSTKGALAGIAAAALMLGSFGTHASWMTAGTITGGKVGAGDLSIESISCDKWLLDTTQDVTADIADGNLLLVPGDVLNRRCTITVNALGTRISANLALESPTLTTSDGTGGNALTDQLNATAYFVTEAGAPISGQDGETATTTTLTSSGEHTLYADLQVSFPDANATNASRNLSALLGDITVTLQA